MQTLQNLEQIFKIFHDGVITEIQGDQKSLNITIECQYLAERPDPQFRFFYLALSEVDQLSLQLETGNLDLCHDPRALKEASEMELEIISARIKGKRVEVSCNIDSKGGTETQFVILSLNGQSIQIFDHEKQELDLNQLNKLAEAYWSNPN